MVLAIFNGVALFETNFVPNSLYKITTLYIADVITGAVTLEALVAKFRSPDDDDVKHERRA